MPYYSHVLQFPELAPFDQETLRFSSFAGRFVRPVTALGLHDKFWFSNYGSFARFRILTDKYAELEPHLIQLRDQLGLIDTGEEKELTLVGDLGHERFLPAAQIAFNPEQRAARIVNFLHATCLLYLECLVETPQGYWRIEENPHPENPLKNTFQSIHHLFCNITQVPLELQLSIRTNWMSQPVIGNIPIRF